MILSVLASPGRRVRPSRVDGSRMAGAHPAARSGPPGRTRLHRPDGAALAPGRRLAPGQRPRRTHQSTLLQAQLSHPTAVLDRALYTPSPTTRQLVYWAKGTS